MVCLILVNLLHIKMTYHLVLCTVEEFLIPLVSLLLRLTFTSHINIVFINASSSFYNGCLKPSEDQECAFSTGKLGGLQIVQLLSSHFWCQKNNAHCGKQCFKNICKSFFSAFYQFEISWTHDQFPWVFLLTQPYFLW